ncbi:MAG: thermostable hemolysin [Gallionella sp.]
MTSNRPNPTIDLTQRSFTVRFSKHDSADRDQLDGFIRDIFRQTYGAEVKPSKSYLMSLRDHDDELIAACSLHSAATEKLSLEIYLDNPVEKILSTLTGQTVQRGDIIEVSDFSASELATARYLITAINDQLHFTSKQWAIINAPPNLRDAFVKLGMDPKIIADADKNRIDPDELRRWGNFFDQNPQIIAISRIDRRNKSRNGQT